MKIIFQVNIAFENHLLYNIQKRKHMGGAQMAKTKKKAKKMSAKRTIITLVAVYVICHLIYGSGSILDLKMQQRQLAQELDAAYTEQTSLQASLDYMNSEDAIEKIAREKLGLVKDDEILIRRVESSQTQ